MILEHKFKRGSQPEFGKQRLQYISFYGQSLWSPKSTNPSGQVDITCHHNSSDLICHRLEFCFDRRPQRKEGVCIRIKRLVDHLEDT